MPSPCALREKYVLPAHVRGRNGVVDTDEFDVARCSIVIRHTETLYAPSYIVQYASVMQKVKAKDSTTPSYHARKPNKPPNQIDQLKSLYPNTVVHLSP